MGKLTPDESRTLLAGVTNEIRAAGDRPVVQLSLDGQAALSLLGTLQLALRHPQNGGRLAEAMRGIAEEIERALGELGPATQQLAAMGWHPEYDDQ
jgi:hypothetical protein